MSDSTGSVLKSLREAWDLSQVKLASKILYDRSEIARVESGKRRMQSRMAAACDEFFGTTPLLVTLVAMDDQLEEGDMRRRTAIATAGLVIGAAGVPGAAALAQVVRQMLEKSTDAAPDWDAVVADLYAQLITAPSAEYGQTLTAQLMLVRSAIATSGNTTDLLRAAAQLGQLYAFWLGNHGDLLTANAWHRSSSDWAIRSGDNQLSACILGRAAARGPYEGVASAKTVVAAVERAKSMTAAPCLGQQAAYSALVHLAALTGDLRAGQDAIEAMRWVADRLPASAPGEVGTPHQRVDSFENYLYARIGPIDIAERVFADASGSLPPVAVWWAEAQVYRGLAAVRDGDVADGVTAALRAMQTLTADNRILGWAARDVLAAVPADFRSDDLDQLTSLAAIGPAPWETLVP
jgi:transcriptional regulator with XRE-family HTH domain